jgi:hypothetical protein
MDAEVVQVMSSRTGGDIGGRPRWVISCGYQIGEKKKITERIAGSLISDWIVRSLMTDGF